MSDGPPPEPVIIHLRRRTPEEQTEWLILQVAFLTARVTKLTEQSEAYLIAIQSLENRMAAVERATPWKAPPKPKKLPPGFPQR